MTPDEINAAARALMEASLALEEAEKEYAEAGAAAAAAELTMKEKRSLHYDAVQRYNSALAVFDPDP